MIAVGNIVRVVNPHARLAYRGQVGVVTGSFPLTDAMIILVKFDFVEHNVQFVESDLVMVVDAKKEHD